MNTYCEVIQKGAPVGSAGYQIEVQLDGSAPLLLPKQGFFELKPFQNPEGVQQGRHRVLYCQQDGARANLEPGVDVLVDVDYGCKSAPKAPPPAPVPDSPSDEEPPEESASANPLEKIKTEEELDKLIDREMVSQHLERSGYGNFRLRAETRTIETLYGLIQRMAAQQQALGERLIQMPRMIAEESQLLVGTITETLKGFHTVIEMQSQTLQAVQKQGELARVPPPP